MMHTQSWSRTRALLLCVVGAFVLTAPPLQAVGTVTTTAIDVGGGVTKYTIAWTASAGGAVSGNAVSIKRGEISAVKIVPSTVTAPTALYDVTLVDTDVVDVLNGQGANQSATLGAYYAFLPALTFDGTQTLDLVVANAGNAGKGVVYVYVRG